APGGGCGGDAGPCPRPTLASSAGIYAAEARVCQAEKNARFGPATSEPGNRAIVSLIQADQRSVNSKVSPDRSGGPTTTRIGARRTRLSKPKAMPVPMTATGTSGTSARAASQPAPRLAGSVVQ